MQKENNQLVTLRECPTSEVMQKYISDGLGNQDQHAVELHVLDCEICSDAITGFSILKNGQDLSRANSFLANRVDFIVSKKKIKKEYVAVWSAAASLLLILGATIIYFLQYNGQNNKTAEFHVTGVSKALPSENLSKSQFKKDNSSGINAEIRNNDAIAYDKKVETPSPLLSAPMPALEGGNNLLKQNNLIFEMEEKAESDASLASQEADQEIKSEITGQSNDVIQKKMFEVAENFISSLHSDISIEKNKEIAATYRKKTINKNAEPSQDQFMMDSLTVNSSSPKYDNSISINHGIDLYNLHDYNNATEIFTHLQKNKKDDFEIISWGILTKIRLNKYPDAESALKLLNTKTSEEAALKNWLTALASVKDEEKTSRQILQEMVKDNSALKFNAEEILKIIP